MNVNDPNKNYQSVESVVVNKASFIAEMRDYGVGPTLVLILTRGNSRAFDYGLARFIQLLREREIPVFVSVAGVEISLEQFESAGTWGVRKSQTVQNPQGKYNAAADLKRLRGELIVMSETDPRYGYVVQRINHLSAMLESAQPPVSEEVRKSDEGLTSVLHQMLIDLSDDQLAEMSIDDLERFKIPKATPTWIALMDRRALAQKALKEKTHVTQQPVVANPNHAQPEAGVIGGGSATPQDADSGRGDSTPSQASQHVLDQPTEGE